MSVREVHAGSEEVVGIEEEDERRRLPVYHLLGLAAGGVLGSGWLLGAQKAHNWAGSDAWLSWLVGGVLMLVIAWVMVELGTAAPKTGGLIFLPLQSSGPLVATVVAAGVWLFYEINLATEARAMTQGLHWPGLFTDSADGAHGLTPLGWACTLAFMAAISVVNLIASRILFRLNSGLTVIKVVIPVLAIVMILAPGIQRHGLQPCPAGEHLLSPKDVLAAVVDSGVIYAFVGFQGPLDLAGNIKRRGMGEAARLRWAVFGTIVASTALYILLQVVFTKYQCHWSLNDTDSPYARFAFVASMGWLGWILRVDAVASPLGAGVVFGHARTREVAALSRAHLTARGLQTARHSSLGKRQRRYDVYWLVLLVDLFIAAILLAIGGGKVGGNGPTLISTTSILTLIVYAFPGVVLISLEGRLDHCSRRRRIVRAWLTRLSFCLIALILYGSGWQDMRLGMATLAVGTVLLLLLPVLPRLVPTVGRFYDAKENVTLFREWRVNPAVQAMVGLVVYLCALSLLTWLGNPAPVNPARHPQPGYLLRELLVGIVVVVFALGAFAMLVRTSKRHVENNEPLLQSPAVLPLVPEANAMTE